MKPYYFALYYMNKTKQNKNLWIDSMYIYVYIYKSIYT